MKVGIAQVDGKWPNLALMKLAAHHRRLGHDVEWFNPLFREEYDAVYASKIFDFTPDDPYLPPDAVRGGTGYNLESTLPPEVEARFPDYSVYPGLDYAIGFTTRGCIRRCPFCVVPEKEGRLRIVGDLYSFWRPETGFRKVRLLDNNLTAAPWDHFRRVFGQLIENRLLVDFSQGLDARLICDDHARLLAKVRIWKQLRIAWDRPEDEAVVRRGIKILLRHIPAWKVMCYVLIGFDTMPEEDLYRIEALRGIGIDPFAMPYDRRDPYQAALARWVNHKAIFNTLSWAEYARLKNVPVGRNGELKVELKTDAAVRSSEANLDPNVLYARSASLALSNESGDLPSRRGA